MIEATTELVGYVHCDQKMYDFMTPLFSSWAEGSGGICTTSDDLMNILDDDEVALPIHNFLRAVLDQCHKCGDFVFSVK